MSRRDVEIPLRILKRLQAHTQDDPITAETIGAEFGLDRRQVMGICQQLLEAGHKVCSTKVKPFGMFIARTPSEAYSTAERMRKEGLKYLVRAKQLMNFNEAQRTIYEEIIDNEVDQELKTA